MEFLIYAITRSVMTACIAVIAYVVVEDNFFKYPLK